jgi:hypothetical protein
MLALWLLSLGPRHRGPRRGGVCERGRRFAPALLLAQMAPGEARLGAPVGLLFEAVADAQLARSTAEPANAGRVMDRGLWRYTRHPTAPRTGGCS